MKVALAPQFIRRYAVLSKTERELCDAAVEALPAAFGHPHRHAGLGVRALRRGVYECRATLSVRDEGPGIPLSEQQRIFDRFYQIESHLTRPGGGVGLGVRGVVNCLKRSAKGPSWEAMMDFTEGATFW